MGLRRAVPFAVSTILVVGGLVPGIGEVQAYPNLPPLPPVPPAISDVIAFAATDGTFAPATQPIAPFSARSGFTFDATCPIVVSDPDLLPEVYTTPPVPPVIAGPACTMTSGGYFDYLGCEFGDMSSLGATSLSGPDGSLNPISYHIDFFAGLGVLSGTATENETDGVRASSYPAELYGVAVLVPAAVLGNDCAELVSSFYIAGAFMVVEPALSS